MVCLGAIIFIHLILAYSASKEYEGLKVENEMRLLFYEAEKGMAPIFMGKCEEFLNPLSSYREKIESHFDKAGLSIQFSSKRLLGIKSLDLFHLEVNLKQSLNKNISTNINGYYLLNRDNDKCFGVL